MKTDLFRKIELLCYGIRNEAIVDMVYSQQNPYDLTRTGNVGLQLLIGESKLAANVPVYNRFTEKSPFTLKQWNSDIIISDNRTETSFPIVTIMSPPWYMDDVGDGCCAGQYVLREGLNTLICSISDSCGYAAKGTQCHFCAIAHHSEHNVREGRQSRIKHIKKSLSAALQSSEEVGSINLTGGNTITVDRGASRYIEYIQAIRKKSAIPICIELSPPGNLSSLQQLKDTGADAVMMNVEIWDKKYRKAVMPGKSIISREEYVTAWEYAVKLFGCGNVSSVIIVGLEEANSVKEAIDCMTDCGVVPSIMPFRPNNGAMLENHETVQPELVDELTQYAAEKILANHIQVKHLSGCIGCGACSAELDYVKKDEVTS